MKTAIPITLGKDSEPESDIAVVKFDTNEYSFRHPEASDIYVLIEVADSTIAKDRKQKAPNLCQKSNFGIFRFSIYTKSRKCANTFVI